MSVELLRRAAAKMRERAERCIEVNGGDKVWKIEDGGIFTDGGRVITTSIDDDDIPHIASWHPDVALAAATALEKYAAMVDESQCFFGEDGVDDAMLAFACAYHLGEDA